MRTFKYCNINEIGNARMFMDNKPHPRFSGELRALANTDTTLINNFFKVAKWIEENCPTLNGEFECRHNPYYKIHLIVENGKAYLCEGSHNVGYSTYLSTTETAVYTQGSCQISPYAFKNVFFFRNDRLEEFLAQWPTIKQFVMCKYKVQSKVYSDDFTA